MIKFKKRINHQNIKNFLKRKKLSKLILSSHHEKLKVNDLVSSKPYMPNLIDLLSLYEIIVRNKRTTILEFGSGWSTLIFAIALSDLKKKYSKQIKKLRRNNPSSREQLSRLFVVC